MSVGGALIWLSLFQLDTDAGDLYDCKHRPGPEVRWCVCERMCQIPSTRPLVLDVLRSEWLSAVTPSLYLDSVIGSGLFYKNSKK